MMTLQALHTSAVMKLGWKMEIIALAYHSDLPIPMYTSALRQSVALTKVSTTVSNLPSNLQLNSHILIQKKYSGNHEEALDRLCFICGDLFNNRVYAVDNYIWMYCVRA